MHLLRGVLRQYVNVQNRGHDAELTSQTPCRLYLETHQPREEPLRGQGYFAIPQCEVRWYQWVRVCRCGETNKRNFEFEIIKG